MCTKSTESELKFGSTFELYMYTQVEAFTYNSLIDTPMDIMVRVAVP